jgi:hypothetical protein
MTEHRRQAASTQAAKAARVAVPGRQLTNAMVEVHPSSMLTN